MEELKRALVELVEREPDFLADLLARLDGRLVERLLARPGAAAAVLKAAAASPEAVRTFALAVAGDPEALRAFAAAVARDPEAARLMAAAAAPHIAIPLNMATKDDLKAVEEGMATKEDVRRAVEELKGVMVTKEDAKRFATKEDVRAVEERMATKEDLQNLVTKEEAARFATKEDLKGLATREEVKALADRLAAVESRVASLESRVAAVERVVRGVQAMQRRLTISIEEEAVERVAALLRGRGLEAECRRGVKLAGVAEWDGLCLAGGLAVLVEAKVSSSRRRVERTAQRLAGLQLAPPPELAGRRLAAAHYALEYADEEAAAEAARRHKVWLVMGRRELTTLEEALG